MDKGGPGGRASCRAGAGRGERAGWREEYPTAEKPAPLGQVAKEH